MYADFDTLNNGSKFFLLFNVENSNLDMWDLGLSTFCTANAH